MRPPLSFFVPCVPPTVTAQQKGAFAMPGGGVRFYKKKKVAQSENTFFGLLRPHVPAEPFGGPLALAVTFSFPWRKSELKRVVSEFSSMPIATRPDADNLSKTILDVMGTLLFWNDDGQIADLHLRKEYSDRPGLTIRLAEADGQRRGAGGRETGIPRPPAAAYLPNSTYPMSDLPHSIADAPPSQDSKGSALAILMRCENDEAPVRHMYSGRGFDATPRCVCGGEYVRVGPENH